MIKKFEEFIAESYDLSKIKKLSGKNANDWKDIDVNSIFPKKFIQRLRNKYQSLETKYYKNRGYVRNGGWFLKTGMETLNVKIEDIYPGQIGVDSDAFDSSKDHEYKKDDSLPQAVKLNDDKLGWIIVLVEGHHRVAKAILSGAKTVKISVKTSNFG